MIVLAPDYYKNFHCIADKCKHSCCIGWEIDIDENTYNTYKKHTGVLKDKFCKCISTEDTVHFVLDENERCPFLNDRNLCEIFSVMGEKSLCQICTDHPRFKNFFSNVTEIGLGLCCEEACRIIVDNNDYFGLYVVENDTSETTILSDEERYYFDIRDTIISNLQNRSKSIFERFQDIWDMLGISIKSFDLNLMFKDLEYMEKDISGMFTEHSVTSNDLYLEQLAVYFVFRHLAGFLDDGMLINRVVFSYIGVLAIVRMCKSHDFDEICDCARIYSSEIEYSEENTEKILTRIGDIFEISI